MSTLEVCGSYELSSLRAVFARGDLLYLGATEQQIPPLRLSLFLAANKIEAEWRDDSIQGGRTMVSKRERQP